jgi:hypothetical protein
MATDLAAGTTVTSAPPAGASDDLPDPALVWRWVGAATRPVVGWVLAGLGVIAIVVGYLGVSREAVVAKQLPYLISGGIGGVALVGFGAALIASEDMRRFRGRLDALEAMVADLHGVLLARPDAPSPNGQRAAEATTGDDRLVALRGGRSFHRASCAMVAGKQGVATISAADARRRGLSPCRLCEPSAR